MHSLLRRQLKQHFGAAESAPEGLQPFLAAVAEAYEAFDQDRLMLERSLELSSTELLQANADMRAIFQALPDLFLRLNAQGVVLEAKGGPSGAAVPVTPTVGARIGDLFPDAAAAIDAALADAGHAGAPAPVVAALTNPDGSATHCEIRCLRLPGRQFLAVVRDITQQAAAERERARGLALLEATLESTADGILVVDAAGAIINFNKRFLDMWHIPLTVAQSGRDEEALAVALDQLRDPEAFVRKVKDLYGAPTAVSWDVLEFKDGRVFERYSQPQSVGGETIGRVWTFHDVTALRRAQEETAVQRTYFRQVLDLLPTVVFAKDETGRYVLVNRTMATLFGSKPDGLVGLTNADIHAGATPLDAGDMEVLFGGLPQHTSEEAVADAAGTVRWFQTIKRAIPSPDGTAQHVLGVATDITERRRGEEDLRRRTEHLMQKQVTLHELAVGQSGSLDADLSRITTGAARMLGVSRVSLWLYDANETTLVCKHLHADGDRELDLGAGTRVEASDYLAYFEALREGRIVPSGDALEDPRTRRLRSAYLDRVGVTSLLDVPVRREGRVIGLVCFEHVGGPRAWTLEERDSANSIADFVSLALESDSRRHLEEQLRQSQKMEAIGLLAGGVAHDFNNLLGVITGYAEMVSEELPPLHEGKDDLAKIVTAANTAADLTRKLLAFSKRQILQVKVFDLNSTLDEFSRMLGRIVGEDLEIRVAKYPKPLTVKADAGQIEQVLLNLCSNSRQAMPHGGVITIDTGTITLTAEQARERAGARAGSYVTLRVSDTGDGMDPETLARVFEPFFTTKSQGTGLGLATVYGIVQQHNGFIEAESARHVGTTFTVYLPLETALAKKVDPVALVKTRGGHETILVAEDEPMLRDLMAESLGHLGYTVMVVADGEQAVKEFENRSEDIALAILDTVMPRLSGPDAYIRMRAVKPHLKAIFISGYAADPAKLSEVLETENLTFIQKPFSPRAVAQKVREVLDRPSGAAA